MPDLCAFSACQDEGVQRVVVTVAEASSWALREGILASVDRDLGEEGPSAAVGLLFCASHAQGIDREHYRARTADLTPNEARVLRHLQGQAAVGGDTLEGIASRLRLSEASVRTMVRRLTDAGAVQRSRYQGVTRSRKRAAKFRAVGEHHEPPAVQPGLGLEEETHA